MSTTYTTTTDRAAEIRKGLKKRHGWSGRDVSVRADYYSMGSSIRISIKNPGVPSAAVEAVARGHESIDRNQWGEILSGGNRFVDVHYDYNTIKAIGTQYMTAVEAAQSKRESQSDNTLIEIAGTPYMIGVGSNGWGFALWDSGRHICEYNSLEGLAQGVGVAMLNHQYFERRATH